MKKILSLRTCLALAALLSNFASASDQPKAIFFVEDASPEVLDPRKFMTESTQEEKAMERISQTIREMAHSTPTIHAIRVNDSSDDDQESQSNFQNATTEEESALSEGEETEQQEAEPTPVREERREEGEPRLSPRSSEDGESNVRAQSDQSSDGQKGQEAESLTSEEPEQKEDLVGAQNPPSPETSEPEEDKPDETNEPEPEVMASDESSSENKQGDEATEPEQHHQEKQEYVKKSRVGPFTDEPTPTVIFHGIQQTCDEHLLKNLVEQVHIGTGGYAECVEVGSGARTSVFRTMQYQVEDACKSIRNHPVFSTRQFSILGLSQGSLIGRYIVETCELKYPVYNLVTVGAPNNGIDFDDTCPTNKGKACLVDKDCDERDDNTRCYVQNKVTKYLPISPYNYLVQSVIGPSNYFKDHKDFDKYTQKAWFLPILNNEREHPNVKTNKERFETLNFLTLVKFKYDPIIYPRESSWFGEVAPSGEIIPMEETGIYKNNTFGLKTLDDQSRLEKILIEGVHLQFVNEHIQDIFVKGLLK